MAQRVPAHQIWDRLDVLHVRSCYISNIIRPHRMHRVYWYRCMVVSLRVCLSDATVSPTKMAELINMPFRTDSSEPNSPCIRWGPDASRHRNLGSAHAIFGSQNSLTTCCYYCYIMLAYWVIDTHTHLTTLCPGLPGWAGTRKVKPMWILLTEWQWHQLDHMQSAPHARQKTMPVPHHSFFIGCMPFLMPNQQRQSTEN